MPEATFLCLDSSEFMRNGDYFPSRMLAVQEACNILTTTKMQSNPENTVGFLTMGGAAVNVRETLTQDFDRMSASLTSCPIGGSLHLMHGLQIASLALAHCRMGGGETHKRIVAFVGSPVTEEPKVLEKFAKVLRKNKIALDIVSFGSDENAELLEKLVGIVNRDGNSHFLHIPQGRSLLDSVLSSALIAGDGGMGAGAAAAAMGGAGDGGAGGAAGGGFEGLGVDPNVDPELAMVLRMSLEDERRRVEAAAAAAGDSAAPATADPDATAPAEAPASSGGAAGAAPEGRPLTEDEEFELALKLSMEQAQTEAQPADAAQDTKPEAAPSAPAEEPQQGDEDAAVAAALEDPDFLAQLARDVNAQLGDAAGEKKDEDDDKDQL